MFFYNLILLDRTKLALASLVPRLFQTFGLLCLRRLLAGNDASPLVVLQILLGETT